MNEPPISFKPSRKIQRFGIVEQHKCPSCGNVYEFHVARAGEKMICRCGVHFEFPVSETAYRFIAIEQFRLIAYRIGWLMGFGAIIALATIGSCMGSNKIGP